MSEEIVTRRCYSCKVEKPISEFHRANPLRHHYACKICRIASQKSYANRSEVRERERIRNRERYRTGKTKLILKKYRKSEKAKQTQRAWRAANLEKVKAYFRKYGEIYRKTEKFRSYRAKYNKAIAKNPLYKERIRARGAFEMAVIRGKIIRPDTCSECGQHGKLQAHHHLGYAPENRFNVKWLCHLCHNNAHAKSN